MTVFDPEKITFFAKTDARGKEVSFGIKARDRQRHMYVVGKTGMGKSTLLENMAAQDIQNGEGMAFIDPHGSAAETLLEYVPAHRVKDVVYFAPFDMEHPVSFNVMEDVGADKRHLVVSGLMSTFKKIWVDQWSARMEYILTNALLVLIEYPDTTLLSVNRLFSDKTYLKKVVAYCKDPAVKSFWVDEYFNYTDRFTAEALPAIQNKIGQFTGNPLIRNIIGQPHSSFDIRQIMDEKKILIMNLSKGLIGDTNANLLGSMLTTRIYLAAMSRADLPVAQMKLMPNFYFYVDEFQSFANATFADILSEARKYHLNLIIAHQYIAQMEDEVRDAVFGNVGTTIAFRVGPFDAEVLETVFAPRFEATDLVNLGFAQIYLTLMIDGIGSQPFSAKTLPPVELPSVSCREMVIDESRKSYANDREAVEKVVVDLHTPQPPQQNASTKKPFDNKRSNNNNNKPAYNKPAQNSVPAKSVNNYQKAPANHSQSGERDRKPVPSQKTPEDLRKILSQMKQADTTENKNNLPPVTKKEVPSNRPQEVKNERVKNEVVQKPRETKNIPQKPTEVNKTSSAKNDLKNALADVLQKTKTQQGNSAVTPTPTPTTANKPKLPQPPVISQQQTPKAETQSSPAAVTKTETVVDKKPNFASVSTPQVKQDEPENKSQIRKVVVEHRRNRENGKAPVQPQSPVNPTQTPSSETNIVDNNLDPKEIKRMLRQSENERSPFN